MFRDLFIFYLDHSFPFWVTAGWREPDALQGPLLEPSGHAHRIKYYRLPPVQWLNKLEKDIHDHQILFWNYIMNKNQELTGS